MVKKAKISFSVVDLLVVVAILMILTATIVPHFAALHNPPNAAKSSQPTAAIQRPR